MHISEVEKARLEKEHSMRNGYQIQDGKRFPHTTNDISEHQFLYKDTENKHARETKPEDYNMEPVR